MRKSPTLFAQAAWLLPFLTVLLITQLAQAAAWITNGPLSAPRSGHTSTLLHNGKVLVTGGADDRYLANAELFDPATGKWTSTGSMTTARGFHTATMLTNGHVLVVGGYGNDSPAQLLSAELYDPATGNWTNTGPTAVAYVFHTATLLSNGQVLVAGGINNSAELYDPSTRTWTKTGSMSRQRWYHAATLLPDGNVLVAGGDYNYLPPGILPKGEIYDPSTGTWRQTGPMTTNRTSPTATMLPDGRVLVAGGWLTAQVATDPPRYSSFSLASAELYDPATETWTATTNTMTTGRNDHTASLLPNGLVLLAGGFKNGPGDQSSLEVFDPHVGAWISTSNTLNQARSDHTATILPDGRILVAGGFSNVRATASTELYDWSNASWTNTGAMEAARYLATMTLLPNGTVLIAGGFQNNVFLSSAELYEPATGAWTNTASLHSPRRYHTATLLPNGTILVAGGQESDEISLSLTSEIYGPTGMWTRTNGTITPRFSHTATLLPNGKVLVVGGMDIDENSLASAELYDVEAGTWTTTGSMHEARNRHTATLLPDGTVLVAGGYGESGPISSAEIYDLATGLWTATSPLGVARAEHSATLLPNRTVLIAGGIGEAETLDSAEAYDLTTGSWTSVASMNTPRSSHTATLLLNGRLLVGGGLVLRNGAWVSVAQAELYDVCRNQWLPAGSLSMGRDHHAAVLLNNGTVLIAGGVGGGNTAELFDSGLGVHESWRPQISVLASPSALGSEIAADGLHFRGYSGASGGGTQDSASNYPLLQLRSIESGQSTFLLTTDWSANSFRSVAFWNFPPGFALATIFVNGIPSASSIANIAVPIPAPMRDIATVRPSDGPFQLSFTNSAGSVFAVLATTNVALPLSAWMPLGRVKEVSPGQFQFTDSQSTTVEERFYQLWAP